MIENQAKEVAAQKIKGDKSETEQLSQAASTGSCNCRAEYEKSLLALNVQIEMLYEQMKTIASNAECQIEPLAKKIKIRDMFPHSEDLKVTSNENDGVFIEENCNGPKDVYDEFSR